MFLLKLTRESNNWKQSSYTGRLVYIAMVSIVLFDKKVLKVRNEDHAFHRCLVLNLE